ncbi:peptidoglycan-binding protein [Streptomyces sp. NPDC049837]|uniref:peptidoglycan-binding domain-containing protein n=1 Tax=Streptomyces sp. NPDC049837 TaxID=3155277 RepID=UPI0034415905
MSMNRTARLITVVAAATALAAPLATAAQAAPVAQPATAVTAAVQAAAAAAVSGPILNEGDTGAEVNALQHLLISHGQTLDVDGQFGPATEAKVKAFQQAKGLTADGIVGPQTWSELVTVLKPGANGPAVKAAQTLLVARGHKLTVDGAFGAGTEAAVKSFQKSAGLAADGVVGPQTWSKLLGGGGGTPGNGDRASIAQQIVANKAFSFATTHVGGKHVQSSARNNIVDTANGLGAMTSPWGHVPNRRVPLDTRMLSGLLKLNTQYGFRIGVSEFVGGEHSAGSRHYRGLAVDINYINGIHVGNKGSQHKAVEAACSKLGADQILGPGDPGHDTHVHCAWK